MSETGLNHGALAIDSTGGLVAAWAEQDGPRGNFQIWSRFRDAGGTWADPELAVAFDSSYAGSVLGAKFPSLAFIEGDSLLMVWHDYRVAGIQNLELFTKVRGPGMAWGDSATEVRLTTSQHPETNGDNSYLPNLVVTPDGTAHVAWYDFRYDGENAEILMKSRTGGAWDTTPGDGPDQTVSLNAGDSQFPAFAAGPDGSLHLAWRDNTDGAFRIHTRTRNPAGIWGATTMLSPAGVAADGVTLAVAADGTLVAAWADARNGEKAIYVRERTPAGVWGAPHRASPPMAGAEEAAVAVDAQNRRCLAWQDGRDGSFYRKIFFQRIEAGAVWDSTGASDVQVSNGDGKSVRPTLVTGANRVFVLWQDTRDGPIEIYFRTAQDSQVGIRDPGPRVTVQLWPNPFRSGITLEQAPTTLDAVRVLDIQGRTRGGFALHEGRGRWDGRDETGRAVPPGIYFLLGRPAPSTGGPTAWLPLGRVVRTR
jgi:hypothetical protein